MVSRSWNALLNNSGQLCRWWLGWITRRFPICLALKSTKIPRVKPLRCKQNPWIFEDNRFWRFPFGTIGDSQIWLVMCQRSLVVLLSCRLHGCHMLQCGWILFCGYDYLLWGRVVRSCATPNQLEDSDRRQGISFKQAENHPGKEGFVYTRILQKAATFIDPQLGFLCV